MIFELDWIWVHWFSDHSLGFGFGYFSGLFWFDLSVFLGIPLGSSMVGLSCLFCWDLLVTWL